MYAMDIYKNNINQFPLDWKKFGWNMKDFPFFKPMNSTNHNDISEIILIPKLISAETVTWGLNRCQ